MFGFSDEEVEFSPAHKRLLRELSIQEDSPGTILHDFEALLDYVRERELALTATYQLPLRALSEINARLAHPVQLGLKRPLQKSYPHIHGLYLLVRASGLTSVDARGKKPQLIVDETLYQIWRDLNPTERYGNLLEAWLLRGKPEIIGEHERPFFIPENFFLSFSFFNRIPDEGLMVAGNSDAEISIGHTPGWHNLALSEVFGLIRVQHAPPQEGKGWQIDRVHRTRFGAALLSLLYAEFFGDFDLLDELEAEGDVPFAVLRPVFQPYFPEWQNDLPAPEWTFREGTHIFKVSLEGFWCRIAVPASSDLDTLAHTILNAVDFDHDHLYQFSYGNRFGSDTTANHPYMDEGPWATEVLVGEVQIGVGEQMHYLFDFGDQWEFELTLEEVDTDSMLDEPSILDDHGNPPEQYPSYDWE